MLRVQRFQSRTRDMRINLRGRDVSVTEQQLHDPQIGTMIQQMCRKRMPKPVR